MLNMGKSDWLANRFDLADWNSNTFANQVCEKLCGKSAPLWIDRWVETYCRFPWIGICLPMDGIAPGRALEEKLMPTIEKETKEPFKPHVIPWEDRRKMEGITWVREYQDPEESQDLEDTEE